MTSRMINFYISSDEKTSGTKNNANYFIYHTCLTNVFIGLNGDKLLPALLHINMGCNSNFYYLDNKITNSNIVGFLKWSSYYDVLGNGYLYSDNNNNSPFFLIMVCTIIL